MKFFPPLSPAFVFSVTDVFVPGPTVFEPPGLLGSLTAFGLGDFSVEFQTIKSMTQKCTMNTRSFIYKKNKKGQKRGFKNIIVPINGSQDT